MTIVMTKPKEIVYPESDGQPMADNTLQFQILPQVVFEILPPGNTISQKVQAVFRNLRFYELHGVEEYYIYDPDHNEFSGWLRKGTRLETIDPIDNWVSPRLGVRFVTTGDELVVDRPDGDRFLTYVEIFKLRELERQRAEQEYQRAEQEYQRAQLEHQRAEHERQRAEQGWERADLERQRAERLAEQLRKLGIDPDQG